MSPELQEIITTISKFENKTEGRQWFKDNRNEIFPLFADLYETDSNSYHSIVEDFAENFPQAKTAIQDEIIKQVRKLLAERLKERLKPHWRDGVEPPDLMPDKNGKLIATQRLLVEILQKSKYISLIFDEHRGTNDFEVYGEYKLPWDVTNKNSLKIEYMIDHREKGVREVIYHSADLKYQQSALKYYLTNFFEKEVDWKALRDAITYAAQQKRVNILQDYFNNGIPKWDGIDRMDLLHRHAGVKNKRWAMIVLMRNIMLPIMARIFHPGYDYRGTAILVGEENIGKSWFTRILSIHTKFYLQFTFGKNTGEAEIGRMLEGRMVVELPDTGGIGTRNDNMIKSFLTQTFDNFRRMRADVVEDIARSCIFIVTANSMESYLGHVGNTRFWPIEVGKFDMESILAELPQLFAQAKYLWDHGETPRPTDEELQLQQEMISQQEVKPNFYYLLLQQLRLQNYRTYFIPDANGWQEGIKIDEILGWWEQDKWFENDKQSYYRREIKSVLHKYFHIESLTRKVPVHRRKIADKPENNYNYCYTGNVSWDEFIDSLGD